MKRLSLFTRGPGIAAMLALLGASAASGCGGTDDLPRQPISGRVSIDGAPLTGAWIEFRPDGNGGITAAGAQVMNGSYSVPREEGLIPGSYRVAITKTEAPAEGPLAEPKSPQKGTSKTNASPDGYGTGFAKQLIPSRYNTQSELVQEVKADQANDFEFELSSKSGSQKD